MTVLVKQFISLLGVKSEDTHLSELLRGSSVALVLRVASFAAAYLFTLLITRGYGAHAMGIFALCLTVIQVTSVVGRLGLDSALLRFVAEYSSRDRKDLIKDVYIKALKIAIPFGLFFSVALFLSAPFIARHIFHKGHLVPHFRMAAVAVLPGVLVFIHSAGLRGLKKIREYIFFQSVAVFLLAFAILAVMLFFFRGAYAPLASYVAGLAIVAGASVVAWRKYSGINVATRIRGIRAKDILSVSVPMLLASSLMFIMQWTDTVMLGMWKTEAEVGIYAVSLRVAMLTGITLFAVNSIAAPKFAELYGTGDMESLGRVARHSTKLIFWSSVPILLALLVLPGPILGIFGPEFKAGVYALVILTAGQMVNAASGAVGYILQMTGRQKAFQSIILAATGINIVLNIILIPRYGINGAALSSTISMVFWNLSSVAYIKHSLGILTIIVPSMKLWRT